MTIREIPENTPDHSRSKDRGVRKILLMGVFWRILIIEIILLIGTLLYEAISRDADISHLLWYALRILGLVGIIILFMMVTLQSFLRKKIIAPLEAIATANERSRKNTYRVEDIDLPKKTPREIKGDSIHAQANARHYPESVGRASSFSRFHSGYLWSLSLTESG